MTILTKMLKWAQKHKFRFLISCISIFLLWLMTRYARQRFLKRGWLAYQYTQLQNQKKSLLHQWVPDEQKEEIRRKILELHNKEREIKEKNELIEKQYRSKIDKINNCVNFECLDELMKK